MFDFFPQILIILALAAIIVIIVRTLPRVAEMEVSEKNKKIDEKKAYLRGGLFLKAISARIKKFSLSIFQNIALELRKFKLRKEEEPQAEAEIKKLVEEKPISSARRVVTDGEEIIDLLEKAASYFGSGNFKQAEKVYIDVIKRDPKNIRAYKGLGRMYKKQGNLKDARASFEQVIRIKPGDSEAREELKELEIRKS